MGLKQVVIGQTLYISIFRSS